LSFLHLFVTFVELATIACVSIVWIAAITTQRDLIGLISVQTIAANAVIQTEVQTNRSFAQRTSVSLVALTSRLLGCRVDNTFAVDAQFRFEISTFLNRTCCASGNQCGLDR
jgi:hypothetical protein